MSSICSTAQHAIQLCDTAIDWSATGDFLSGAGTLAGAFAVIYAAGKGASTFRQWKEQKLAERQIEQAERILTAVDVAKDALAHVRNIVMWNHEMDAARAKLAAGEDWESHSIDQQRRLVHAQVYYDRLARTHDDTITLNSCRPMARAFFGDEVADAIKMIGGQFWVVKTYADASITDQGNDHEFSNLIRRALYDNNLEVGSEVSDRVRASIATIEARLLPVLRHQISSSAVMRIADGWRAKLTNSIEKLRKSGGQEKSEG